MESSLKIILVLLSIAIILGFFIQFVPFLNESGTRTACKNWVNMESKTKIAGAKLPSLFDSPCVTFSDKITKKNEIEETLANNMYDCWNMYGSGKLDFFSDWDLGSSEIYCMVCEEIEVDEKINTNLDVDDFEIYLSNHNPPNHEESYTEYFLGPGKSSIDFGSGNIQINKENPIYVLFTVAKKRQSPSFGSKDTAIVATLCFTGGKIGVFFGGVPGAMIGCGIGIIGGVATSIAGQADVLYPSMFVASGKEILNKGCDDYYYNPQKKFYEDII